MNLIGDCQGGWLATVYAALRPEPINTLTIAGAPVDLGRVECQLNLLAGAPDHITPPDQVFALADCASTPVEDTERRLTSGGHLGLFMGHEAPAEQWPPLLAAMQACSG